MSKDRVYTNGELYRRLGNIEGKVDLLLQRNQNNSDRMDGLETRLRSVEAFQARAVGRATVMGALSGSVVGAVVVAGVRLLTGV